MSSEEESIDYVLAELSKRLNDQVTVVDIVQTAMAEAFRAGASHELNDRQRAEKLGEATGTAVASILELFHDRKTD